MSRVPTSTDHSSSNANWFMRHLAMTYNDAEQSTAMQQLSNQVSVETVWYRTVEVIDFYPIST
jgi:hypothetical protein